MYRCLDYVDLVSWRRVPVFGWIERAAYIIGVVVFFCQAEDGIRNLVRSRGLGEVYKRQGWWAAPALTEKLLANQSVACL